MKVKTLLGLLTAVLVSGCSEQNASQQVQPVKVEITTVGASQSGQGQGYSGTIEEESGTSLSFAGMGTVQSINVSEGQFVQRGQLIGVIDETSARNAYDAALAAKEQALDAQKRMQMLHDAGSLPEIKWVEVQTQVRQAEASEQIAKKGLTDTKLYAPYSGYIIQKNVEAGANVGIGTPVAKLVKIDQVKVKISVPEEEIAGISVGQTLQVRVAALGDKVFEGKVTEKNVSADAMSRSYDVKAVIPNADHELLPGMIAEVNTGSGTASADAQAQPSTRETVITLPPSVIELNSDNRTFVWTVSDGKAQKTFVTTGQNVGDKVEIVSGLHQGDRVITLGQQKVSSGMEVTE